MSAVRAILPIAVVTVASLLAAMPWGVASRQGSMLPMLVAGLVYLWNVRRAGAVPHIAVFAVGIGLDAVGQGPLGHWPLVFLAASACAMLARDLFRALDSRHVLVSALAYVVAMTLLLAFAWALRSVFDLTPSDADGMFAALAVCLFAYPGLAALVALFEGATASESDTPSARTR